MQPDSPHVTAWSSPAGERRRKPTRGGIRPKQSKPRQSRPSVVLPRCHNRSMVASVLGREDALTALDRSLDDGRSRPTVVCIRGEAGIGKTVLLESAREMARERGYRILVCRPTSAETQLSFAALSDLLDPLAPEMDRLPRPQRVALDIALLRRTPSDRGPDVRTVGAATLSLLNEACRESPVLVEVDDAQWLDPPSLQAVIFAVRRCRGPFVLASALRDGFESPLTTIIPPGAGEPHILHIGPLPSATLSHLLRERLGRVVDRATMSRVAAISGGNPLFALELARSTHGFGPSPAPHSELTRTMRARYDALPAAARDALLMVSALAAPTAELVHEAGIEAPEAALDPAEQEGIIRWSGHRLDFSHPMWREVIYQGAEPHTRRAAHRTLSSVVRDMEERARHLAQSSVRLEPGILRSIVTGASAARLRGAPSAAAGLLGLAFERGATSPVLRLQAAVDHFVAGEPECARRLATALVDEGEPGSPRAAALRLLGEICLHDEDFTSAVPFLQQAHDEATGEPATRAEVSIDLAFALSHLGDNDQGYTWALRAEAYAAATGDGAVTAEASAAAAVLHFLTGHGVDVERIDRALGTEDADRASPPYRWPAMCAAVVFLGSQDVDRARTALDQARQRCRDRGLESGLWFVLMRQTELAMWEGDVASAQASARELAEWSMVARDDSLSAGVGAIHIVLSAWCGQLEDARAAYQQFLELDAGAHPIHTFAAMAALGMAEHAADHIPEAAALLEPVADITLALHIGEPMATPFFAEATEVLVAAGRSDKALALVEMLERWAARSGTRWPSGVGHRGRAALCLEANDLEEAEAELGLALAAFDTHALRYETARTYLLLGAVQRRRRQRARARESLARAQELFALMGAAGWSARAQQEGERLGLQRLDAIELTASERRIAELAASGLTNAAAAARLAISPKTVEAHLARVYRKLGIRSRAELGHWLASGGPTPPR